MWISRFQSVSSGLFWLTDFWSKNISKCHICCVIYSLKYLNWINESLDLWLSGLSGFDSPGGRNGNTNRQNRWTENKYVETQKHKNTKTQKHKNTSLTWNRSSQSHEHHGGHGVPQPHGAAEVWRQISDDGGEEADDADGDQETGPAVPVLCGRDAGEQNLPEHGEEMHDVVVTGWKALLATLLVIIAVTWGERNRLIYVVYIVSPAFFFFFFLLILFYILCCF